MMGRLAILIVCFCAVGTTVVATDSGEVVQRGFAIASAEQALERAEAFVGKNLMVRAESDSDELPAAAMEKSVSMSSVPLVTQREAVSSVWEISTPDLSTAQTTSCSETQKCRVWLDPTTGVFLQARIVYGDWFDTDTAESIGSLVESELENSVYQFHGFPDVPPKASLAKILLGSKMSNRCEATETYFWYVLLSRFDGEAKPCWCVLDRSVPIEMISYPSDTSVVTPDPIIGNDMIVYDATSGALMTIGNVVIH